MSKTNLALLGAVAALLHTTALAQVTMTPLPTFGTGGWIAPGTHPYVSIGNTERGLSVNPLTGNLVLVARQNVGGISNNIRILNGATGADVGGLVNTGLAGGTFLVNMCDVGDDGAIYVANLATVATSSFKVYKWTSEAAGLTTAPTVAYDAVSGVSRIGDSFAVHGGAASPAKFAAAGSSIVSPSNFVVGPLDATNASVAYLSVPGALGSSNDYRLGMTFVDASTVIGNQGANARLTTFDPVTATVAASIPLGGVARRAIDYAVIAGRPVVAVIDTNSSQVTVFDISDPLVPVQLATANNTTGVLTANGNGTGSVSWGPVTGNSAVLYAMSSNQGIQAFTFTMGPNANATILGTGCDGLGFGTNGLPSLGNTLFELAVTNVPVWAPVALVAFGSTSIPGGLDLTSIGMPSCFAYNTLDLGLFATGPVVAGVGLFPFAIPNNPALAGLVLSSQGASFSLANTMGLSSSNGIELSLGF